MSSDFNMLRLEAPRPIAMITAGTRSAEHVESASPATWIRCLVRHQTQAERDLHQLFEACGNQFDRQDRRMVAIEAAYNELSDGARYLYEQTQNNVRVSEDWIRTELATTANAYQTFTSSRYGRTSPRSSRTPAFSRQSRAYNCHDFMTPWLSKQKPTSPDLST